MKYSDGIVQSGTVLYYLKRVDVVKEKFSMVW